MLGVILASISTLFSEIGFSFGKKESAAHRESFFELGFLNYFWSTVFFIALVTIPFFGVLGGQYSDFLFTTASLPTFIPRAVLGIVNLHLGLHALTTANRSTSAFLRVTTIPILLMLDIALGYTIAPNELAAIFIIITVTLALFLPQGLDKRGFWFALGSSITAAVTISLYQYNITHYNSVAGEQTILSLILLCYLFFMAVTTTRKNPLRLLLRPRAAIQSITLGFGALFGSFAFLFAPSSVIVSILRGTSILWSILSGYSFFHERHLSTKLTGFAALGTALMLLALT